MSSPRPPIPPDEIYCDESLQRGGYDLIGGLWLTRASARRLRHIIANIREHFNYRYEFKWVKATGSELSPVYRELAQKLTDQIYAGRAAFNCIVLPRHLIDYKRYHENDWELGYYKFMHWLIRKRAEAGRSFILRIDHRTSRQSDPLSTLKRVINAGVKKDLAIRHDCCRDVQARPSKEDDLLQAADVLLGAVGFHYAGRHQDPASSMAKNILADRIARGIRKPDLAFASSRFETRFNIWRWTPSPSEDRENPNG